MKRTSHGAVATRGALSALIAGGSLAFAAQASASDLILNEYNAVGPTKYLEDGECDPAFDCEEPGNGGDWVELVVITDDLDIGGWTIEWTNDDPTPKSGSITFKDVPFWDGLPAGTIITIRSDDTTDVSFNDVCTNGDWLLRTWGADALGFYDASRDGVVPDAPEGLNIEGFEFAPDGTTGLLGFRAPTYPHPRDPSKRYALIVQVTNILDLVNGVGGQTGRAQFGELIYFDLDSRSIRDLRRNDSGEYLILAGPPADATPGVNDTYALYTWDGEPRNDPELNQELPNPDTLTSDSWEGIVSVPHPTDPGATVRLIADSGTTDFYGTGETKDLVEGHRKSYSQTFALY